MSRFFIPQQCIKGDIATISGKETHHILDVMRLGKGDRIQTFDGSGKFYQGLILETKNKRVKLKIERVWEDFSKPNLEITLLQALPRKGKMDYIVEKTTELGVNEIIPIQTARTVVKLNDSKQAYRKQRWQKIAQAAAKQCGRTTIPEIKDLMLLKDGLSSLIDFDLKLIFCLDETTRNLKDILQRKSNAKKIIVLIGPEGDFTVDEVQQARNFGYIAASLGGNVLKTDTACLSALAMINYELI